MKEDTLIREEKKKMISKAIFLNTLLSELSPIPDDVWFDGEKILCESPNVANLVSGLIDLVMEEPMPSGYNCKTDQNPGYYYINVC